jgi:hypothetical protein
VGTIAAAPAVAVIVVVAVDRAEAAGIVEEAVDQAEADPDPAKFHTDTLNTIPSNTNLTLHYI